MADRLVVFNADDLGISDGTNAGVLAAARAGLVRETSLCVTGIAAESGAREARAHGDLGVGLHLSLTLGTALTGPLRGLTDAGGRFLPLRRVLASCWLRRPKPDEVAREVRAQIARARELCGPLTHVNGHHHVHVFPRIRDVVIRILREEAIPHVRIPSERARGARFASVRLLRRMGRNFAGLARRDGLQLRTLPFAGLSLFDAADYRARFLDAARGLRDPAVEWMVHPREDDADFARLDHHPAGAYANHGAELAALTDPDFVAEVRALGIRPARYSEL